MVARGKLLDTGIVPEGYPVVNGKLSPIGKLPDSRRVAFWLVAGSYQRGSGVIVRAAPGFIPEGLKADKSELGQVSQGKLDAVFLVAAHMRVFGKLVDI